MVLEANEVVESEVSFGGQSQENVLATEPVIASIVNVEDINVDEFVSAAEALKLQDAQEELDMRPYLFDGNSKRHILLDSGSQVCAWPPDPGDRVDPKVRLKAVNGTDLKCYGYKDVEVRINRKNYPVRVVKTDVKSPILGWNFTRKHRLFTGWTEWGDVVLSDPKAKVQQILKYRAINHDQTHRIAMVDCSPDTPSKSPEQLAFELASLESLDDVINHAVLVNDIDKVPEGPYKELIKKFPELLELSFKTEDPKNKIVHRIKTTDNDPIRAKVRNYPKGSPKAVQGKKAIEELERLGIIEKVDPSKPNHFTSALHFALKPDGSLRPVGDFRLLNQKTLLDLYPLPSLKDFHQDIAGSKIFSKVDLAKAFHQLMIDKRDRWKTCITTPWGLFNFRRLAMGLQNSAQSFQRHLDDVIKGIPGVFCYLDDLLIYSRNKKDHLKTLELLFDRLNKAGLTLALDKCEFGKDRLNYLGFEVSEKGIAPIPKKIEALQKFPAPVKQKQLLAFLGALNYYRASLPSLDPDEVHLKPRTPAQVLEPLYKLATCVIPKKSSFEQIWKNSKNVQKAFVDAKSLLEKAVTLNFPDPSAPLALTTDASKLALGGVLEQFVDGSWRPLGMWSKALKPQQQGYSTYKRELMAIQLGMRYFNKDFNGRHLIVFSDHKPIVGSFKSNDLQAHDPQALNAINEISQWTSDIRHRAGKTIPVADWLSRPEDCPIGKAYDLVPEGEISELTLERRSFVDHQPSCQYHTQDVQYVSPEATLAALENVALETLNPAALAAEQLTDPDCLSHKAGVMPKNVVMGTVRMSGVDLYCEISDPNNPRPLVPISQRNLVLNLLHHGDHPGQKEQVRRVSSNYYWPKLRANVKEFSRSCHACQVAKQSATEDPGIGDFPVPDKRFQAIHLDIVGPLPESHGHKFLLTIYDRCSRWVEAFALKRDCADEIAKAFLQYVSRFGLPSSACSDNGNSFVSNLWQDVLRTFGIKVKFTPAYHAATNGAIERKHQDIKNALKAALVEMGNNHRDQWFMALPWVLLGMRVKFQPNLDASAAQMVLQMSPKIPGQLLGDPGPPLNNTQSRALLDQLYRLADRPPVPTSGKRIFKDISHTDDATHVYVKVDNPECLCPKFEGPYRIVSRPSRSQVKVKLGLYKNGSLRTQVYHWSSCKVAVVREGAPDAERPKLGRPAKSGTPGVQRPGSPEADPDPLPAFLLKSNKPVANVPTNSREESNASSSSSSRPSRSTRNQSPVYT